MFGIKCLAWSYYKKVQWFQKRNQMISVFRANLMLELDNLKSLEIGMTAYSII